MSLSTIQQELQVPKTKYNQFGGFKYRSAEDILEAVKPLLDSEHIITIDTEIVHIAERYYVKATARYVHLVNGGTPEQSASAYAREPEQKKGMAEPQVTGMCLSYAKKYALGNLLLIDDGGDPDEFDNTHNGGGNPSPPTPSKSVNRTAAPDPSPAKEELGEMYDRVAEGKTTETAVPANRPAMSKVERDYMNALRDYYKSQETPHFKVVNTKMADAVWLNMGRWPSSESDCKIIKQYVTFVDVSEKV